MGVPDIVSPRHKDAVVCGVCTSASKADTLWVHCGTYLYLVEAEIEMS